MSKLDELGDKKKALEKASSAAREHLLSELEEARLRTDKIGKNLLIAGGVLVFSYFLVQLLTGKESEAEKKKPRVVKSIRTGITNRVVQGLTQEMMLFLLSFARKRLLEYLKDHRHGESADNEIS